MGKKKNNGIRITLIEVMIVIAIIGILAAIMIPNFSAYRFRSLGPIPLSSPIIVDEKEQELAIGSMAIGSPKTMSLDETKNLYLMVDIKKEIYGLFVSLPEEYDRIGAKVRMSNRMQATLTSHDFNIKNGTPLIQAISFNNTTKWKWLLKPKKAGNNEVTVTLSALIPVQGEQTPLVIKSYKRIITVTVTNTTKTWNFLKENMGWLWAPLAAALGGLYYLLKSLLRRWSNPHY